MPSPSPVISVRRPPPGRAPCPPGCPAGSRSPWLTGSEARYLASSGSRELSAVAGAPSSRRATGPGRAPRGRRAAGDLPPGRGSRRTAPSSAASGPSAAARLRPAPRRRRVADAHPLPGVHRLDHRHGMRWTRNGFTTVMPVAVRDDLRPQRESVDQAGDRAAGRPAHGRRTGPRTAPGPRSRRRSRPRRPPTPTRSASRRGGPGVTAFAVAFGWHGADPRQVMRTRGSRTA